MAVNNISMATNIVSIPMTSHEIANLTGKEHRHVMRDIRTMFENLEEDDQPTQSFS